ncbi:ADP-ribosylglycohydrolase family protein [Solitalea canadensis]|uniref:ADP-ribosylglycohydrolase n=1 Tax=Solitalea canadensis (strain ATCC 29591 / DSM 3403 / JCM 21819 / LMG 8368 / NBRC 15130 / NCIMB 12057 / USAM 9D) TaxID=929556 RepID=H8KPL5_SOLCM|nr:ADP-ribosylglycohydrolase family protein [Solitalea canadensis]AFD05913.1 ADP-ribosylglycohydrolase [Solitalea canadensis DSM 3403]
MHRNYIKDALLGLAVGDALGVPVEFMTREEIRTNPVTTMQAFGTHNQPAGTWSDDSSLTFCLAEMLCKGYDLDELALYMIRWKESAFWTAHNHVFDIGIATSQAINLLKKGISPLLSGGNSEQSNGNGSLMRILPLLFYVKEKPIQERFKCVQEISSLTHRHIISAVACFIYLEYALKLLNGVDKLLALTQAGLDVKNFLIMHDLISIEEFDRFKRILPNETGIVTINDLDETEIHSSGYVLHSLEASIWSVLSTNNYNDAVLKAVNLGSDTDTTGAITGGLAGLLYGWQEIPPEWLNLLVKRTDIENLSEKLFAVIY